MRCRRAERLLLERGLAPLPSADARALEAHLIRCRECSARNAIEARLTPELQALRDEEPASIDVLERVALGIAALPVGARAVPRARALGWAVAAAGAAAFMLAGGLWEISPRLPEIARHAAALLAGLEAVLSAAMAPALALGSALARALLHLLAALAPLLRRLEPLATAAILSGFVIMTSVIAAVLARDFRKPHPTGEGTR